jgi:hypothetical protein
MIPDYPRLPKPCRDPVSCVRFVTRAGPARSNQRAPADFTEGLHGEWTTSDTTGAVYKVTTEKA